MGTGTRGKLPEWKPFHLEERPAPERHIIDTSEWTSPNYRYVKGCHFGDIGVYERARRICKYFVLELRIEWQRRVRKYLFVELNEGEIKGKVQRQSFIISPGRDARRASPSPGSTASGAPNVDSSSDTRRLRRR